MKVLSWNCRGLGNRATVRALHKILLTYQPEVVFLMETKRTAHEMRVLNQSIFHFDGCMATDCEGERHSRRGGLAICWRNPVDLSLINFTNNHMLFKVSDCTNGTEWYLTGIYGWPESENRWKTWQLLERVSRSTNESWCCVGDFNEIMWSDEKQGGRPRSLQAMQSFRDALSRCGLMDIGYTGNKFTWTNMRGGDHNIQARLDRVLTNSEWNLSYPNHYVSHLARYKSDHNPILLVFDTQEEEEAQRRKQRRFRFENMWLEHKDFVPFLDNTWQSLAGQDSLVDKMKACGEAMMDWDKFTFGNVKKSIREHYEMLESLQRKQHCENTIDKIHQIEVELDDLLKKEEIMWRQRSRALWLKEGDRNTKFFHKKANHRKKRNTIKRLMDDSGRWITKQDDLSLLIKDYYMNLFNSEGRDEDTDYVINCIEHKVTNSMNEELTKPYTREEIQQALKQMHPSKAPGPDGMSPFFFQKFWHIVGGDVSRDILKILNEGTDPSYLNQTHIVLIPKKKVPETPKDFRPISLCNVIFRIITKCIANRLKSILHSIITVNQSAFIPGRFITDNAMTAFEIFHSMKKKKTGRHGCMAMKLDMSKAYDRVEWDFLQKVMIKMGFSLSWVNLIMRCVSSVSYSVLFNGVESEYFHPKRGLRQGDPLSPYLFLLCADVFSTLIVKAEREKRIHGFKVARIAPPVSHLFFADDSILFFRANRQELGEIQKIIRSYEVASGQRINFEKTEVMTSRNVSDELMDELCAQINVRRVTHHQKYLGLPTLIGKSKKQVFSIILERVQQKCKNWKECSLTKGGREVMVKAVLQAIPTYTMSCFLLPNEILHSIEMTMASFFWGAKEREKKIHWVGWNNLTKRKDVGGMNFRDLRCFNLAMLARQMWNLMHKQDTIIFKILKAKYFPRTDLQHAGLGFQPSYLWRSLLSSREVVQEGTSWIVGNGESIYIKSDRWIGNFPPRRIRTDNTLIDDSLRVSSLIDPETKQWKNDVVQTLLKDDADEILAIPLSHRRPADKMVWGFTKNGHFSVRSAYRVAVSLRSNADVSHNGQSSTSTCWKQLWKMKTLPKISIFLWQACNEALPTCSNLIKRGVDIDPICKLCGEDIESQSHLFLRCQKTSQVWQSCALRLQNIQSKESFQSLLWGSLKNHPMEYNEMLAIVAWCIWISRNKVYFENRQWSCCEVLENIQRLWAELQKVRPKNQRRIRSTTNIDPKDWNPPLDGWLKVDSDIAVLGPLIIGMGFVIRKAGGEVILAGRKEALAAGDSTMREGLGVRYALLQAEEHGLTNLVVGSDSQSLINSINGSVSAQAGLLAIVEDIKDIASRIGNVVFVFNRRELNQAAHYMAKGPSGLFCNAIPPHIVPYV